MFRKSLLGLALLAMLLPILPNAAYGTVTRVSFVEDFGFFT